jgi:segregation and condensation protein B
MSKVRNPAILEALLFASSKPLSMDNLSESSGWEKKEIRESLKALKDEYEAQGRGFTLEEVAGGFQLRSDPRFADQVSKLFASRAKRRFTRSSLETLSIIAYRQPVTRAEVEQIRGVDSGAVLKTLLSQVMIRVLGRKEAPGRPILYGSTREFLEYFGLRDLESLPTLEEVAELLEEHDVPTERLSDGATEEQNDDNQDNDDSTERLSDTTEDNDDNNLNPNDDDNASDSDTGEHSVE